jgi:probable HAF family extracellular repeat protein
MKDLGTLGGTNSYPESINDANQMVGAADVSSTISDAFLWINGTMLNIGSLGAQGSVANAINYDPLTKTFTQIAGWSLTSDSSAVHAVIWDANLQITDLGALGGPDSFGFANNCIGQVVGEAATPADQMHAFRWDPGIGMMDLGTLGGSSSQAQGINCSGTIVGFSFLAGDTQQDAFVYTPNAGMKDIGNLGGSMSQATAINKAGRVVGVSNTPGNADTHAFVWTTTGGLQDLNKLIPSKSGWSLKVASAISGTGSIVGLGTINGAAHAYLLVSAK